MTVPASQANRYTYAGNGVTTAFAYSSKFLANADLVVISVNNTTGVETVKTLTTHYTVTGAGTSAGTVTMLTAPASGTTLVIYGDPVVSQLVDPVNGDDLDVDVVIEAPLDRLTIIARRLKDIVTRSLRQPEGDTTDIGRMPAAADRASKYMAFDAAGDPIASSGTDGVGGVPVSTFMKTVLDDTSAAAARATLGVPSNAEAVLDTIIDAKGDIIAGTAADTPAVLTVGANGTIPMARSAATVGLAYVAALTKAIHGFTYANNVADATNDIDIAAGGAMDSTGAYWIAGAALTKRLDAAWAVGDNQGGLDTGAIGNSEYYIWAIARSDTGVVDYLFSLSATAPTMPANYDFKRLIGWFKREAGAIAGFKTYETAGGGIEFLWKAPTLDVNLSNTLTTADRTDTIRVPTSFSTLAQINARAFDASSNGFVWIFCPDQTGAAPSASAAPLCNISWNTTLTVELAELRIRTSATGQIGARATVATVDTYMVSTIGFTWGRH